MIHMFTEFFANHNDLAGWLSQILWAVYYAAPAPATPSPHSLGIGPSTVNRNLYPY
jgi:hypothetical protein